MKKITRVDALNTAIEALSENTEVVEVLTSIRDSIAKANSRPKSDKPTKAQQENAILRGKVVALLDANIPHTVTEVLAMSPDFAGMSTQKMSALLNGAVKAGEAIKVSEKRVTKFLRA